MVLASEFSPDPDWRPSTLTDVYTVGGIKRIMAWLEEMRRYEAAVLAKSGSGLTRPGNLVLGDEYVRVMSAWCGAGAFVCISERYKLSQRARPLLGDGMGLYVRGVAGRPSIG